MRPVNLIPPEERRGDRAPVRTGALPYVLVAVAAVAVVAVALTTLVGNQVDDREAQLAGIESEAQSVAAQAQALAPYAEFASLSQSRTATVTSLAQSRFDWERVMRELARVIPPDVWLTNLTGSVGGAADSESAGSISSGITGPSLTIIGCGAGHEAVARFLAALEDIDGVTRTGISRSELGEPKASGEAPTAAPAAPEDGASSRSDCEVRESVSEFEIVVAFDSATPAVPPAAAPPESAPESPVSTPETDAAESSLNEQTGEAKRASEIVPGVGK